MFRFNLSCNVCESVFAEMGAVIVLVFVSGVATVAAVVFFSIIWFMCEANVMNERINNSTHTQIGDPKHFDGSLAKCCYTNNYFELYSLWNDHLFVSTVFIIYRILTIQNVFGTVISRWYNILLTLKNGTSYSMCFHGQRISGRNNGSLKC